MVGPNGLDPPCWRAGMVAAGGGQVLRPFCRERMENAHVRCRTFVIPSGRLMRPRPLAFRSGKNCSRYGLHLLENAWDRAGGDGRTPRHEAAFRRRRGGPAGSGTRLVASCSLHRRREPQRARGDWYDLVVRTNGPGHRARHHAGTYLDLFLARRRRAGKSTFSRSCRSGKTLGPLLGAGSCVSPSLPTHDGELTAVNGAAHGGRISASASPLAGASGGPGRIDGRSGSVTNYHITRHRFSDLNRCPAKPSPQSPQSVYGGTGPSHGFAGVQCFFWPLAAKKPPCRNNRGLVPSVWFVLIGQQHFCLKSRGHAFGYKVA